MKTVCAVEWYQVVTKDHYNFMRHAYISEIFPLLQRQEWSEPISCHKAPVKGFPLSPLPEGDEQRF
jgi:hypothetical protein